MHIQYSFCHLALQGLSHLSRHNFAKQSASSKQRIGVGHLSTATYIKLFRMEATSGQPKVEREWPCMFVQNNRYIYCRIYHIYQTRINCFKARFLLPPRGTVYTTCMYFELPATEKTVATSHVTLFVGRETLYNGKKFQVMKRTCALK
jgi:hypothetical protein